MTLRSILTARRSVPSGRRAGFRPRLEPLEDREVPGAYHLLTFAGPDGQPLRVDTTRPELLPAVRCRASC